MQLLATEIDDMTFSIDGSNVLEPIVAMISVEKIITLANIHGAGIMFLLNVNLWIKEYYAKKISDEGFLVSEFY